MTTVFENQEFDSQSDLDHPFGDDAVFESCRFLHFKLPELRLKNCRFIDCEFEHCDLSNAILTSCSFRDVRFTDSKLIGINWTSSKNIHHLHFERSFLDYSSFAQLDLRLSHFSECEIKTADFSNCNLGGAQMIHCNLEDSAFHQTNFEKADLRASFGFHIDPRENKLKHATLGPEGGILLLKAMQINIE